MSIYQKNKITIIVVNYNSTKSVRELIKSLNNIHEITGEIIIVNNDSNNYVRNEKLKLIKVINNHKNIGFARAVNQGIFAAKYNYILLINPDCILTDNSPIKTLNTLINNRKIAIIGGKLINKTTKKIQLSANSRPTFMTGLCEFTNLKKIFPDNKYTNKFWIEKNRVVSEPIKVFSVCGAYMFIRKNTVFFNEKYFLYLEDLEIGNECIKKNYEIWFDPNSSITHLGGGSNNSKFHTVLSHWYKSRKIYFRDNLPRLQGLILYIIFDIEEKLLSIFHILKGSVNE